MGILMKKCKIHFKQFINKNILITGGGSGIGAASARVLSARGATVGIADLNEENAKALAEEIVDAEREFSRAVRSVAAAYGTLKDLRSPLKRLRDARTASVGKNVQQPDIEAILIDIRSDDISIAKTAIRSILERVIVSDNSVEVIPRL